MPRRAGLTDTNAWNSWLAKRSGRVEAALDDILPARNEKPTSIHRAMRHSVFPAGKRIRPGLVVLGFETAGGRGRAGVYLGCAVELLHTFSLIHDDLPCMDDDALRRGRPSCHAKFGEATAVLAGDALQVLAFDVLAHLSAPAERRIEVIAQITEAVGTGGVIGGQVVDIESEGKRVAPRTLRWIHSRKTGDLLRCALVSGGTLAGASRPLRSRLVRFGDSFGLLFQIVDDLLNEVGTAEMLGRATGGDRERGKATYPSVFGLERSRSIFRKTVAECRELIPVGSPRNSVFSGLIDAVIGRMPLEWTEGLIEPDSRT